MGYWNEDLTSFLTVSQKLLSIKYLKDKPYMETQIEKWKIEV